MAPDQVVYRQSKRPISKRRRASVVIMKDIFESAKKYSNKPIKVPKLTEITEEHSATISMKSKINFQCRDNLMEILKSKSSLVRFRRFLKSEFSEENVDFWIDCENYKQRKENKLKKYADIICKKYIVFGAPREVNLDGKIKQDILNNLENPTRSCFDVAQNRIYYLMETDSFQRFPTKEQQKIYDHMFLKDHKSAFIKNIFNNGRRRLSI